MRGSRGCGTPPNKMQMGRERQIHLGGNPGLGILNKEPVMVLDFVRAIGRTAAPTLWCCAPEWRDLGRENFLSSPTLHMKFITSKFCKSLWQGRSQNTPPKDHSKLVSSDSSKVRGKGFQFPALALSKSKSDTDTDCARAAWICAKMCTNFWTQWLKLIIEIVKICENWMPWPVRATAMALHWLHARARRLSLAFQIWWDQTITTHGPRLIKPYFKLRYWRVERFW